MDVSSALTEIESLANKLEVQVVYEHLTGEGVSSGGLCKLKGKWRVIIERRCSPSERLSILAQALSRFDLESHFLSPSLREYVERFRPPARAKEQPEAATEPEPEVMTEPASEPDMETALADTLDPQTVAGNCEADCGKQT